MPKRPSVSLSCRSEAGLKHLKLISHEYNHCLLSTQVQNVDFSIEGGSFMQPKTIKL